MVFVALIVLFPLVLASPGVEVKIATNYLLLQKWTTSTITLEATCFNDTKSNVLLQILVGNEKVVVVHPQTFILEPVNKNYTLFLNASSTGHTQLRFYSDDEDIRITNGIVDVDVIVHFSLRIVSSCILWSYTICLVLAFYPQIYLNYRRNSVVGLSFDFLLFSTIGHLRFIMFYTAVNLTSSPEEIRKHSSFNLNSTIYNFHGFFILAVVIVQCCIYEKAKQRVSSASRILFILIVLCSIFFMAAEGFLMAQWFNWLYSGLMITISLLKFCPQIFMNYKRKSTKGLSMGMIGFKSVAGIFEFLQLLVDSTNYGNFAILGTPLMITVSIFYIGFPVFILVQHFYLYKRSSETTSNN